ALRSPARAARAALILSQFKSEALPALPELQIVTRDSNHDLRRAAASAIESIGAAASNAIPTLILALNDPAAQTIAARTLAAFGPNAAAAAPELVKVLADPSRAAGRGEPRSNAARTLGHLGVRTPAVVNTLKDAADNPEA